MELSLFLAQVFGIYLVVAGALVIFRKKLMIKMLGEMDISLMIFGGFISFILGLLVVLAHNVWTGWPIIITLLGYLMILKGVINLFFPDWGLKWGRKLYSGAGLYYVGVIDLIIGAFLVWIAFFP